MTQADTIAPTPITSRQDVIELAFDSALRAGQCAQKVAQGYLSFQTTFRNLTKRAAERFQERDWQGSQLDAVDRAELLDQFVAQTTAGIKTTFGELVAQQRFWKSVKRHFENLIDELPDSVFCKIFFNAITRRLHRMIGVASPLEFVVTDYCLLTAIDRQAALLTIERGDSTHSMLMQALNVLPLDAEWQDPAASAHQISQHFDAQVSRATVASLASIEFLDTLLYRFTRAYVMGRFKGEGWQLPFALALINTDAGVVIDSVMLGESELSALLECGRAELHAELDHVTSTVAYLQILAPKLRASELVAVLGWPATSRLSVVLN